MTRWTFLSPIIYQKLLKKFKHPNPIHPHHAPHAWTTPVYGKQPNMQPQINLLVLMNMPRNTYKQYPKLFNTIYVLHSGTKNWCHTTNVLLHFSIDIIKASLRAKPVSCVNSTRRHAAFMSPRPMQQLQPKASHWTEALW